MQTFASIRENLEGFFSLPNHVVVLLLLEWLNSYRNYGIRMVQYQYFTNEFGLSDTECGSLLGLKATLDAVFGLAGGVAVDAFGVRKTTLFALAMALCGRFLLAFGRTTMHLYAACLFFSPFGEAFLMVGVYRVALYKLTTPRIRQFAFGVQYATWNFSGAMANVVIDGMRREGDQEWFGMVFTGLRRSVVTTWVAVLVAMCLSLFFLQDVDVSHPDDPEMSEGEAETLPGEGTVEAEKELHNVCEGDGGAGERVGSSEQPSGRKGAEEETACAGGENRAGDSETAAAEGEMDGGNACWNKRGGREGPGEESVGVPLLGQAEAVGGRCSAGNALSRLACWRREAVARFVITPTEPRGVEAMERLREVRRQHGVLVAMGSFLSGLCAELREMLCLRALWRVVVFSLAVFFVCKQWVEMEAVLPSFIERSYGEHVPITAVISIHFWAGMVLPPTCAAFTSHREAFEVMLPGMTLMAASSVCLVASPTVSGAFFWIVFLTLGEAVWSPRWQAWVMELAPVGREGAFVAVSSLKDLLISWPSLLFIGWLNETFNPNCTLCRDHLGHFCSSPLADGSCASPSSLCPALDDLSPPLLACPATCLQCPGYQARPVELWSVVLGFSLLSPLLVWLLLPFLRGAASPVQRWQSSAGKTQGAAAA